MATMISDEDKIKSQDAHYSEIRSLLESVARKSYTPDQGVVRHKLPPNQVSIPETMRTAEAAKMLSEKAAAEAEVKPFVHDFDFRPMDGANAVRQVMLRYFGTTGKGVMGQNADLTINVDHDTKIKVPWGRFSFAPLHGHIELTTNRNNEYGDCFRLIVFAPGEMESAADGLAVLVEDYLREFSIYKGKAFTITKDPNSRMGEEIKYLRLVEDPTVTYNKEVEGQLQDTIWATCEFPEYMSKKLKVKTNLKALLHGPYGTGKSECLRRTAQIATKFGRTYIQFPTKGNLEDLTRTISVARQHQPSIIAIEDIESLMENGDPTFNAKLSSLVDGVETKDDEVMIMMTSNHPEKLPKLMLRRGRVDALIYVGPLERDALERMVKAVIGIENLDPNTDFNAIFGVMEGWTPSFIRSTFEDAKRSAGARMAREYRDAGKDPMTEPLKMVLTTQDFERAAVAATDQHAMHDGIADNVKKVTLDSVMKDLVVSTLTSGEIQGAEDNGEWHMQFVKADS